MTHRTRGQAFVDKQVAIRRARLEKKVIRSKIKKQIAKRLHRSVSVGPLQKLDVSNLFRQMRNDRCVSWILEKHNVVGVQRHVASLGASMK